MPPATVFGPAYFKKFYLSAATRVVTAGEMRLRARLIAAILAQTGIPVRSIMDAGCGIGLLREPFKEVLPRARYVGLEASDYLCARYGWTKGSVVDYSPQKPCDLVVCYDVLQYLGDTAAARALANFGRLCRGVLYFSALTRYDLKHNADPERTDAAVHLRSAHWYRSRLRRDFRDVGLGFWLRRGAPIMLWQLESD